MKLSHFHFSVKDTELTILWFEKILDLKPIEHSPGMAVFSFEGVDIVFHKGSDESPMTIALKTDDCKASYEKALSRGATARTPPRDKGEVIGADIIGPGKLVIEFEQTL